MDGYNFPIIMTPITAWFYNLETPCIFTEDILANNNS